MCKKYRKCSQCGENIATWHDTDSSSHFKYYCDNCVPRVGSVINIYNLDDFGEPLFSKLGNIMWWDKSCVVRDFSKSGSLLRLNDSFYYEYLDGLGRRNPSDKFECSSDGFSIGSNNYSNFMVNYESIVDRFDYCSINHLTHSESFELKNILGEIFLRHRSLYNRKEISYNLLMSKFGSYIFSITNRGSILSIHDKFLKFYLYYRIELKKCRYGK